MRVLFAFLVVFALLVINIDKTHAGIDEKHVDLIGEVTTTDGKPVPGATVVVYTAHPKLGISHYCPSCYPDCSKQQLTTSTGRFKIPALADWLKFDILVVKDGFDSKFANGVDPSKGILRIALDRSVNDTEHGIVGARLVDQHGQPIRGATVKAQGEFKGQGLMLGYTSDVQSIAISDAHGDVRFFPKADLTRLLVVVSARDHSQLVTTWRRVNDQLLAQVVLQDGATITGKLRDDNGRALSGIAMVLEGFDQSVVRDMPINEEISTDDQGRFTFANAPEGSEYRVTARIDSLGTRGLSAISKEFMTEESGTTTNIDVVAHPAVSIDGQIILSDGNALAEKSTINLSRERLSDALFTQLDDHGRFHLEGVPLDENLALNIAINGYKLHPSAFAKGNTYLLQAALARGERQFNIVLDPAGH